MIELFNMGGPLFMGLLTLVGIGAIVTAILTWTKSGSLTAAEFDRKMGFVKSAGLFALVLGILGQLIGLYGAFSAIEQMGNVSPAMLAGGVKVSSITTMYGMILFLISYALWFLANFVRK